MRIATGLARADAGEVRWDGRPLDEDVRRRIGYMPEEGGLHPKMKLGQQLTYFTPPGTGPDRWRPLLHRVTEKGLMPGWRDAFGG